MGAGLKRVAKACGGLSVAANGKTVNYDGDGNIMSEKKLPAMIDAVSLMELKLREKNLVKKLKYHIELKMRNGQAYPIEYYRMDTPEQVLGWINHLCSKSWVTPDHIRQLIRTAEDRGTVVHHTS